ncbi:MAG: thioredoxin family protein [Clostridia bacterium]
MAEIIKFDLQSLKKAINNEKYVIVYFYSDWAAPCRAMKDVMQGVSEMFDGYVVFGMLDAEQFKELFVIFDIKSVPTVCFFENGKVVDRVEGYIPLTQLGNRIGKRIE